LVNAATAVVLGYLIGSIPSAYIVGRLMGKIDMRQEGDGRISASAVHKRLGVIPYLLVVVMDVGEGALSIFVATMLTEYQLAILLAGFAAVVGHNWSVFLKFKGGLGATTIYGVLVYLAWWQVLTAAAIAFALFLIIRKSGLSTAVLIIIVSIILFIQKSPLIVVVYPFTLILLMVLKRFQVSRTCPR
jgi:glycerol-3-phosphate acyltransferase PlsY